MDFEWDAEKNRENIRKHGVDFEDAKRIFDGFTLNAVDERFGYDEIREVSIGLVNANALVVVIHTDRDGACRIISARPALKRERRRYEQAILKAFDA